MLQATSGGEIGSQLILELLHARGICFVLIRLGGVCCYPSALLRWGGTYCPGVQVSASGSCVPLSITAQAFIRIHMFMHHAAAPQAKQIEAYVTRDEAWVKNIGSSLALRHEGVRVQLLA